MYLPLAILASFAFLYSIAAARLDETPVTGPMIFISFGLLTGPLGFGWLELEVTDDEIRVLADLTLAMLLFSDAANVNRSVLEAGYRLPVRMLLIGLPGVIGLGSLVGWLLFPELGLLAVAILATCLAATDAALGKAVVANKAVPARLREALNVESGLNDGLCVPVLLLLIALATDGDGGTGVAKLAAGFFVQELGIGLAVGLGLAVAGFWLYRQAWRAGWISSEWRQLPVVLLALSCFAVAQSLHGSGFIAAFTGGFVFGYLARRRAHDLVLETEGIGETLGMLTWAIFGAAVIPAVVDVLSWPVVGYALLSLTVIRMLPIVLSLIDIKEPFESKLFVAWFGPRGLASIVFAVIVLHSGVAGAEFIGVAIACTIVLSAFLHGLTASPLASALRARLKHESGSG